jgi:hypothetical protein
MCGVNRLAAKEKVPSSGVENPSGDKCPTNVVDLSTIVILLGRGLW